MRSLCMATILGCLAVLQGCATGKDSGKAEERGAADIVDAITSATAGNNSCPAGTTRICRTTGPVSECGCARDSLVQRSIMGSSTW